MPPLQLVGRVTKAGFMNKTVTVSVDRKVLHPRTHKLLRRTSKYLTHDPTNVLRVEDLVKIQNCPKKSKTKNFELHTILKRGWEGQQLDQQKPSTSDEAASTL